MNAQVQNYVISLTNINSQATSSLPFISGTRIKTKFTCNPIFIHNYNTKVIIKRRVTKKFF